MKKLLTEHSFQFIFVTLLLVPILSFAETLQPYVPLVTIPGVTNTGFGNLPQYLNQLYLALIAIGALIAVVKIIMAGVKWSFSGIVTDKAAAKSDIKGALLGLAILLAPYVVLKEINPELTNFNFFRNVNNEMKVNLDTRNAPSNLQGSGANEVTQATCALQNKRLSVFTEGSETVRVCVDANFETEATCAFKKQELKIITEGSNSVRFCVDPTPTTPPVSTGTVGGCNDGNCDDLGLSRD